MPAPSDPLIDSLLRRWIFPMVKRGKIFRIPYGEAERQALVDDGEYEPDFGPFLRQFLLALAGPAWLPGSYYPAGWYRAVKARGGDPRGMEPSPELLRPYFRDELRVDLRGHWWLGPKPLTGRVLKFFLKHLDYDERLNLYRLRYPLESAEEIQYLHPESPPLRIRRIDPRSHPPRLHLNDGSAESLRVETLWLDGQDRLYGRVRALNLEAEFDDPARWEILSTLEQDGTRCFVTIGGKKMEIPVRP